PPPPHRHRRRRPLRRRAAGGGRGVGRAGHQPGVAGGGDHRRARLPAGGGRHRPRPGPRAGRGRAPRRRPRQRLPLPGGPMIATIYRVTLRTQAKKGRLAALILLGVVGIVIGLAVGLSDRPDPVRAATNMINAFGLSLYAPVVTLVFASASLGDPAEDGTLVYLWLRPVARWQIVAGTYLATLTVALPL